MRSSTADIIAKCETVFDNNGFAASGMDTLTAAAGVSTRTLYKHVGSKAELTVAVLTARMDRFFDRGEVSTIDDLFAHLQSWIETEGARGCMFLRAQAEADDSQAGVRVAVAEYRRRLRLLIADSVYMELGRGDPDLSEQVLILYEGATSAASYRGRQAVTAARTATRSLFEHAHD